MNRRAEVIAVLFCTAWGILIGEPCMATANVTHRRAAVTIEQTGLKITEKALQLRYEITNEAEDDVWICDSMHVGAQWHFEASVREGQETLLIRRRLNVAAEGLGAPATGLYVRLRVGETRKELMSFSLPIRSRRVVIGGGPSRPVQVATRLVFEIGYYDENLPATLLEILTRADGKTPQTAYGDPSEIKRHMGGPLHFARLNEGLRNRNGRVLVPYTWQKLKGEKLARLTLEAISIPYLEQYEGLAALDPGPCTRVEIRFKPSAWEFFFPDRDELGLLSPGERETLQSMHIFSVTDPQVVNSLVDKLKTDDDDAFIVEHATARLLCYDGDKQTKSLILDGETSILVENGQVFRFSDWHGRRDRTLLGITPEIRSFALRADCASNLNDLCHRLRLFFAGESSSSQSLLVGRRTIYPDPGKWCEEVTTLFRRTAPRDVIVRRYVCPGAGEGKCHYAMNPHCEPDSPGEIVLLFETKAGWNQHGGPELFTFDNHDPKGGCVLLNDGTVKFIRTQEALHALRWK